MVYNPDTVVLSGHKNQSRRDDSPRNDPWMGSVSSVVGRRVHVVDGEDKTVVGSVDTFDRALDRELREGRRADGDGVTRLVVRNRPLEANLRATEIGMVHTREVDFLDEDLRYRLTLVLKGHVGSVVNRLNIEGLIGGRGRLVDPLGPGTPSTNWRAFRLCI